MRSRGEKVNAKWTRTNARDCGVQAEAGEEELLQLTREHVPRKEGATDRPVIAAQAKEGTVVEAFEWAEGGVEKAHSNPVVLKLWERYADACEIVPLNQLAESSTVFASFTPLDVS